MKLCDGGRAGLLHPCAQGALWSGTFPGGRQAFPFGGPAQPPQAGEDSGAKAMITAPCREPLCFPCSLWDTWMPCVRSPCARGTHRHPGCPGLGPADTHRLVSWWPGDHSKCRSSSQLVRAGSPAHALESLTHFIVTMNPPSMCYPILQIGIPRKNKTKQNKQTKKRNPQRLNNLPTVLIHQTSGRAISKPLPHRPMSDYTPTLSPFTFNC